MPLFPVKSSARQYRKFPELFSLNCSFSQLVLDTRMSQAVSLLGADNRGVACNSAVVTVNVTRQMQPPASFPAVLKLWVQASNNSL